MALFIAPHPDSYLMRQSFHMPLYCACAQCADAAQADALANALGSALPHCTAFCDGSRAILYFNCETQQLDEHAAALCDVIGDIPTGLSGPFASRQNAHGCWKKALRACVRPGLTFYSSLRFSMLHADCRDSVAQQGFSWEDFLHKDFLRILDSDHKNGTDYANSLYAYLSCGKNLKEAATTLNLHRNTLNYRIDRIQELFVLDLDDRNLCFELLFSARLYFLNPYEYNAPAGNVSGHPEPGVIERALWHMLSHEPLETELVSELRRANGSWYLVLSDIEGLHETAQDELYNQFIKNPLVTATVYDSDKLLAIVSGPDESRNGFRAFVEKLAADCGCSFMIGQPFFHLDRLDKQFLLTDTANRVAATINSAAGLHFAEDYMSYVYFMMAQKHVVLSDYYCDDVIRVMDFDYDNSSELSKSLYVYLSHFMNMKQAADELFVHRNTLEYHIRKIEQMLCVDISNIDLSFEMLCTYRMLAIESI